MQPTRHLAAGTLLLSALSTVLLIGLAGCDTRAQGAPAPQAVPVDVAPAVQRLLPDTLEFTGRIEAAELVEIRPRIGGALQQVHVKDGAVVARRALLFSIDLRPYQAELARSDAALATARAQQTLADKEQQRANTLLPQQALSRQEVDQLAASLETASAAVQQAEAALRTARLNRDYVAVRAPIAGRISRIDVTQCNLVNDQRVLTTLVGSDRVHAWFDVSEGTFLRLRAATVSAVVLPALAGCASGPDYSAPGLPLAAGFVHAPAGPLQAADATTFARFWQQFGDATLDRLVQAALQANNDVRIAQARLAEARATLNSTQAEALPSLGAEAAVARSVTPEWQQPGASRGQRTNTVYAPTAVMNWELELFGRNARASESAAALVSAQARGVGGAQAAVVVAVAGQYLALRGLQQRLAVAEESLVNQRETLRLSEARLVAGRSTQFDVARARTQVAITGAGVPALQALAARTVQRLATLTGLPPDGLTTELAEARPLPGLPITDLAQLPVGTPQALLRRRPDIRVAERQLAASSADIGVAMADRFPRISLSGLLGLNSNRAGDLSSSGAALYSLGASLSWTAFDFGRTTARIQASQARAERSRLVYEQTVLTARKETENALSGYTRQAQQAAELTAAARSAQDAATLARQRFAAGTIDQLSVLDAERQLLTARDQLVQVQAGTASALVDVYRALCGGWQVGEPAPKPSGALR